MSAEAINSASNAPLKIQGLGSGLKTEEIISGLMTIERRPLTRLQQEQVLQQSQESALRSLQSSLQTLVSNTSELGLPGLFEGHQTVNSSEPSRVSAMISGSGAAIGGYELEVTQLASASQRTFSFKSPAAEGALTIDGHEIKLSAGMSIGALVATINSDSEASVYAAAVNGETVVLSDRSTGKPAAGFIEVTDATGTLTEKAGLAREGKNAEYKLDGVAGSSASNTLTEAIAGVTLTLNALTTTGPVTVNVAAPTAETSKIKSEVQAFVKQYNSTLEAIEQEVAAKPATSLQARAESRTGLLFGDTELSGLITSMRQSIYTPLEGLPEQMSSLASIGVSTGAASASPSQSAIEGKLTIDEAQLEEALQTNPAGVQKMLKQWSAGFEKTLNAYAEPGAGTLAQRISSDESEVTTIGQQITAMSEMLTVKQQNLEARYLALETAMSKISSQSSWLSKQLASLPTESASSSSSSSSLG
jgi:flagellar hook-associated protein 2